MKRFSCIFYLCACVIFDIQAQCFDMSTLSGDGITCRYGTYSNPDQNIGIGYQDGRYTHQVMSDPSQRDPIVSQLQTIPSGENYSVRLGNSSVHSKAESITYDYTPTKDRPILLLKYAAVMQNPSHPASEQPRLKMNVYDLNGVQIEPECMSFDFISSPDLGWNTISSYGETLLWKDWTYIGVDMSPYIGRKLRIKLTNYDCDQGAHYGYAYIHLSCQQKRIVSKACGDAANTAFSAPSGFEYSWYKIQNGSSLFMGTAQTVTVPIDGGEYRCDLHQVGRPECSFSLNVFAERRYPIADFTLRKVEGCADTIYLTNTSAVSANGVTKNSPLEPCDEAVWDLGDGRVVNTYQLSSIPIVYDHAGTYNIQLTAKLIDGGCSDITRKTITVAGSQDPHTRTISASICEGSFYPFGGQNLTESGRYTHVVPTERGCDSTTTLFLSVHPTYLLEDSVIFCPGDSVIWRGRTIKRAGVYYDRLKSSLNCDSVYKLSARLYPTYHVKDTAYFCGNDSLFLHGRFVKQQGTYIDTLQTMEGCDSIVQTFVEKKPYFYTRRDVTICMNEEYEFHGEYYNVPGTYAINLTSQYGCDSILELNLHVNPSYLIPTYVEICHDHSYWFRGRELDAPGIYYDTLLTQSGCDSIFQLVLNKTPIHLFQDTVTICEGSYYNFRGRKVYDAGFHYDSLKTVSGCDSVYQLLLQVEPLAFQVIDTAFCGEVYDFRGMPITQSGTYFDTVKTAFGCDSVFQLNLTFYPSYLFKQIINQCEGDVFEFRGELIDKPGVYHDSLITINGCDSVYQLVYNVGPSYLQIKYDTVCSNTPYDFRGRTITRPGIFIDSLTTKSGCDSLFQLVLEHQQSYSFIAEETGCRGTVFFQGKEIEESGYYYDSLQTKVCKCDSVYGLRATILPTYVFDDTVNVCDHERYNFRGREILESGVYYDSLLTFTGCDSVYRLHINVTPTLRDTLIDTVCIGDTYYFAGIPLTQEGFYSDTLADPMGYRCIIHSLALGAKPESRIIDANVEMICADDSIYTLVFHYHGSKPYTYSIYYDQHALLHGFLDVVDAPFVDTIYAPMPVYKDGDYLRPDYYHARLEFQNGFCDPHKSGMDFDLLIRYPSWVIRQHWNDVVAVRNAKYNGGYTFSNYEWEVNGRMLNTTDPHYSNLYMPELRFGDLVSAYLTREGENYAIPTCPIEIRDRSAQIDGENPVIIYPTAVPQSMPVVKMIATESAMYYITDSYGHLIQSGNLDNEELQQIQLPSVAGLYYFCIRGANSISTVKVLVQ